MTASVSAHISQAPALSAQHGDGHPRISGLVSLAACGPPEARRAVISQAPTLAARLGAPHPQITQAAVLVAYSTFVPDPSRHRAWSYVLDGHSWYVLDLGAEGTWAYDRTTKQWCHVYTQGSVQWNVQQGTTWGTRVVGCDLLYGYVWEVDPSQPLDEEWRDINHVVTGGLMTRSRNWVGNANVRVACSIGDLDDITPGVTMNLSWSDDGGGTYTTPISIPMAEDQFSQEVSFDGLGSFQSPGRVFVLQDSGGPFRIDGADAGVNNFDDDSTTGAQ